jgi:Spy/CpxP family protein refolding chaperone
MNMTRNLMMLIVATAVAAAAPAYAQQAQPGAHYDDEMGFDNPPGRGNAAMEEKREAIRKKIEAVRIWRLTEELKLDTSTSARLASILSSMDQQRRDIMREQMAAMRELRTALRSPKPDESKLKAALEKLEKSHRAMQELREKEFRALKDVLTIEQQARFLVFQQQFQRDMRGVIAEARGNGPGSGRMGGRGGRTPVGPGRPADN